MKVKYQLYQSSDSNSTSRYEFDVTKCMFSFGNITEKLRIASFNCTGETVVDLYAGVYCGFVSLCL